MEKGLKWLSLILLLTFGLAIVNVASAPSAVVYVDPPLIEDDTLQSGDYFVVDVYVSDVIDLYSWQIRMNFNNTILEATDCIQGDILAGQPEGTIWMENIRNANGYLLMGETTWGQYPGVGNETHPASGWLGSVNFTVVGYGETELDIDNYPATFMQDSTFPPKDIPFDAENGYFSNKLAGDFDGDKDVDYTDFLTFAGSYLKVSGQPGYNPQCDFDHDGDCDYQDFLTFAGNYLKSIP